VYTVVDNLSGKVESPLIEADLIREARAGSDAAWEALVGQHQEAVFRLAYLLTGDASDADDVAQEAFIRAFRSLHRFDSARPWRPWVLSIAANLARNRRRSIGRYFAHLSRYARLNPEPVLNPEGAVVEQHRVQALWHAVQRLEPADQEVIYLRYFLELPVEETAAVLQVAPGTVKSRLHRALNRLRLVVEAEYPQLREEVASNE
jgi:RNA polymerase sigma-70 factor (ECF subfamily)